MMGMAKVMISMPDELLAQVDRCAKRAGMTRSGYLQEWARRGVEADAGERAAAIRAFLDQARDWGGQSGNSAEWVRRDRERDTP